MKKGKKRVVNYLIIGILVLLLGLWINSRWTAWFVSPAEVDFSFASAPDRVTLTAGEDFISERNVSWRCDTLERESGLLLVDAIGDTVRLSAKSQLVKSNGGSDMFYWVALDSLVEGADYSYSVFSGDSISGWYDFKMPVRGEVRRFAFVSDVQDTIDGNSGELFDKVYRKYRDYDFVAYGGDLIEAPIDKYWSYLYQGGDSLLASVASVATTGNHEYHKGVIKRLDNRWTSTFVNPKNGPSDRLGRSYFITDNDKLLFISIDTDGLTEPIALWRTRSWLDSLFSENDAQWRIVIMHHPIYSARGKSNWFLSCAIEPILDKYGVDLVLQNHEHGYMRLPSPNGDGDGLPYYVTSNASHKTYDLIPYEGCVKCIEHMKIYQDLTIDDNELVFTAYDAAMDTIVDSFTIKR